MGVLCWLHKAFKSTHVRCIGLVPVQNGNHSKFSTKQQLHKSGCFQKSNNPKMKGIFHYTQETSTRNQALDVEVPWEQRPRGFLGHALALEGKESRARASPCERCHFQKVKVSKSQAHNKTKIYKLKTSSTTTNIEFKQSIISVCFSNNTHLTHNNIDFTTQTSIQPLDI